MPVYTPRALPEPLRDLTALALDVRWTWSHSNDTLWRSLDATLWEQTGNPWLMLQFVLAERLETLATDRSFLEALRAAVEERRRFLDAPGWFRDTHHGALKQAAYFSMEFGLHEALPLYASGLGILAGDHLKTASDLDVPLVGVGILWQRGYFRQLLDELGEQHELYPHNDPGRLPIKPVTTASGDLLEVTLQLPGRQLRLLTWEACVGRTRLLLLDANHPVNSPVDRGLTESLYGSDPEVRLLQELILGIGGWRLLRALDLPVEVCHLNEGHAAFVVLERARSFMSDHDVSFREALWATRAGNVFTTHTAVSAGFDSFGQPLLDRYTGYFNDYVRQLGVSWQDVLALGRKDPTDQSEPFGMAYLALRGCAHVNGVSELHGEVSRRLFRDLFPRWPEREVPIGSITNGVHVPSWDSPAADELWTAAAGHERWRGTQERLGECIAARTDQELWALRNSQRARLVDWVRIRLRQQLAQRGRPDSELRDADKALDPTALTIGFARRFTAYKRPGLLLSDPEWLHRLLRDSGKAVQIVLAGKAHPADGEGKRLIGEWVRFTRSHGLSRSVVFIEDYDMDVAKELVAGVDLWINTPRRPWEASGTSGMKILVNGGLNASELDGWWAEAYAPEVGWAIGDGREHAEPEWDRYQAEVLYRMLETEIVPMFHERDSTGIPRAWLQRIRASMRDLAPRFSSGRMLREYVETVYLPAARDYRARSTDGASAARALAAWEERILAHWHDVRFGELAVDVQNDTLRFSVPVWQAGLTADEIGVHLIADPLASEDAVNVPMILDTHAAYCGESLLYKATVKTARPPDHFTPRVVPRHASARLPLELTTVLWR